MDNQSRFGEPLDLEDLLDFAEIDEADIDSAIEWFDEHASEDWQGALDTPPFSPQNVV
jgi:hypothetical protein